MNEKQKKIMVPYEEKTDTCQDCSNHPCDCGLPAGYTPTPRTDKCLTFDSIALCETLERELTAVTEQRDGLRSAVDYASDQLTRVTEQRDRLAEALEQIASSDPNWRDCLLIARKALQSLNQPTP